MKTAYHITSYANWEKIRTEGLIPYSLKDKPDLEELFGKTKIIYGWPELPVGHGLTGHVIHRAWVLQAWRMVLLKFKYKHHLGEIWNCSVYHVGSVEKWVYHAWEDNIEMILIPHYVPPEDITFVCEWNFEEYVNGNTLAAIPEIKVTEAGRAYRPNEGRKKAGKLRKNLEQPA